MEVNIEELGSIKPELQQVDKALTIDSESTGNNLISKTTQNEKNTESMELEEEGSQLNQSTDLSGVN